MYARYLTTRETRNISSFMHAKEHVNALRETLWRFQGFTARLGSKSRDTARFRVNISMGETA